MLMHIEVLNQMGYLSFFTWVLFSWIFFIKSTYQLQNSETELLLQLRKHLECPNALDSWEFLTGDFCTLATTPHMSITCQNDSVTELKIMGDKFSKVGEFNGFAIPNQTLSQHFSIDSFATTLTRLTNLRVVSLVSLGIWGPLPDKLHRLEALEFLDMSSNYLFGSIPQEVSRLIKLHTLTLDGNFFNDTLPDWLDSLSDLAILSLKGNRLKGQLPPSICNITTLTDIALSHNELSGKLPDMSALSSLHLLDLRENLLNSALPAMPRGLTTVLLSKNSFSGGIPEQFGQLHQLQHLDLSFNSLTGTPLPALFSLPNLTYLNLANNMLTGPLPAHLRCGDALGFVDISSNRLVGTLPTCLGNTSEGRVVKFEGNCLSIDTIHQHGQSFCTGVDVKRKHLGGKEIAVLVGVVGGAVFLISVFAVGLLMLFRRYSSKGRVEQHTLPKVLHDNPVSLDFPDPLANARIISEAAKLGTQGAPEYRVFALAELSEATNNFHQLAFLGEGSLGKLYKGRLENGTYVAIRCLTLFKKHSIRNIKVRLDLLLKLRHPHLVRLLGHCIDGWGQDESTTNKVFLVYEYMPNGNFHAHLSEGCQEKVLKWSDRLAVLIGVAKALQFLHSGVVPASFNNRLKTNNILLDEHQIAKLSDYGMPLITAEIEKLDARGNSKPWQKRKLEDDVYNFGFILLESLVGPIVSGKGEAFLLNEMTSFGSQDGRRRIVDPVVLTTSSQESLSIVISITNKCISVESSMRPSFEDVLWNLQYAAQVQATADSEQKSDTASQS